MPHNVVLGFCLLTTLATCIPVEMNPRNKCMYSRQILPGLSHINVSDSAGKRCWGDVQLPLCKGYCKTSESGTHTFPQRVQNSSVCVLIQTGFEEIELTCDEGADESIRFVKIPKGERCGCRRLPLE